MAELVQWLPASSVREVTDERLKQRLGEELADVLLYLVRLADVAGVDLGGEASRKLAKNDARFPVEGYQGLAPERRE